MDINGLTTQKINWDDFSFSEQKGDSGKSVYKEVLSGPYRTRLAEYSAHYKSAYWCDKGHIIHCINGALTLHFKNKADIELKGGESIILSSNDAHTAETGDKPALLFIIDNA